MALTTAKFYITKTAEKVMRLDRNGEPVKALEIKGLFKTEISGIDTTKKVTIYQTTGKDLNRLHMYLYDGRTITVSVYSIKATGNSYTALGWVKDLGNEGRDKSREPKYWSCVASY